MPTKNYDMPTLTSRNDTVARLGTTQRVWWPAEGHTIQWINLSAIGPDFTQPRQVLPMALRQALAGGERTPRQVMQELLAMGRENVSEALAILDGDNGLKALAASIKEQGLIQEPGVYPVPTPDGQEQFVLAYGDRRYWAHWL